MLNLKSLLLTAVLCAFSAGAAAETVSVHLKIENLGATFAEEADGSYSLRSAQVGCLMKVKSSEGDQEEVDCSAQAGVGVANGATLHVKKNGKKIELRMTSADADGKMTSETIRGQLIQNSPGLQKYKMSLSELQKKFSAAASGEGVSVKASVKFTGDGFIVIEGKELTLSYPKIDLKIVGKANY